MEALHCKACDIQFKYPSHFNIHVKSKAHHFKVNPESRPALSCDACSVHFRSYKEGARHLATKKHAKNVAKTDS